MAELKVRRLPADVLARLKEDAERKGIGTETLARQILTDYATAAKIRSVEDRYVSLAKDMTGPYQKDREQLIQVIRENHIIMEELLKQLAK
jgi:plasmid stability protein